jgi:hypothetical protein
MILTKRWLGLYGWILPIYIDKLRKGCRCATRARVPPPPAGPWAWRGERTDGREWFCHSICIIMGVTLFLCWRWLHCKSFACYRRLHPSTSTHLLRPSPDPLCFPTASIYSELLRQSFFFASETTTYSAALWFSPSRFLRALELGE